MEKKINILHLLSWFPTPDDPNSGNFCLKHIRSVSNDVNSVILSAFIDGKATSEREIETIPHENFVHILIHLKDAGSRWRNRIRLFKAYNIGYQYIKKNHFTPDLIHQHVTLPVGRMAWYWKKRFRIPYVLTEHWTIYQPQNREMMTWRNRAVIRRIANNAAAILPVSEDLQHNMERYGIRAPYFVVPNVVDTQLFRPAGERSDGRKHILHISTLRDEAKNFSGILRVIKQLAQQRQDFVLDVVHDYPKPEFERFVHENALADFVVFHGKKTEAEIVEYYQRADFFLLFSNFENLPCVIIESYACGLPVVTTDVGGIREIANDQRGRVQAAHDEKQLLDNVNFMLDHCGEFNRKDIREYAERNFAVEVIGKQILRAYDFALGATH